MEKKIVKVTNPDYLQKEMWPLIVELADMLNQPGISAHSMMAFFLYGIMNKTLELWAALIDNKVVGFRGLMILTAPYYSTGAGAYFYMKEKDKELTQQLYDKYADFMKRNNLKYWMVHSPNKKLGEHFKKKYKELGLETINISYNYLGKRIIGG